MTTQPSSINYADRMRALQTMRGLLAVPVTDELKGLLLNAQREEMMRAEPDQNLMQFLSMLQGQDENARANAQAFLDRLLASMPPPPEPVALATPIAPAAPTAAEPATPAAPAVADVAAQLSSLASSIPQVQPPAGAPVAYRGLDAYASDEVSLSFVDDTGGALPEEHFTIIKAKTKTDPSKSIIGIRGLVFSVKDNDKLNPGLSFITPMDTILFKDAKGGNLTVKIALRLPTALVKFDDHIAPTVRHAGAFIETYHLLNEGYMFLVEVNVVPLNDGQFVLQLDRDTLRFDRQTKEGKPALDDVAHLNALRFVADNLVVAGFLGVTP